MLSFSFGDTWCYSEFIVSNFILSNPYLPTKVIRVSALEKYSYLLILLDILRAILAIIFEGPHCGKTELLNSTFFRM